MRKIFSTMFLSISMMFVATGMVAAACPADLMLSKQSMTNSTFVEETLIGVDVSADTATNCTTGESWAANITPAGDGSYTVDIGSMTMEMRQHSGYFGSRWIDKDGVRHQLLDEAKARWTTAVKLPGLKKIE
jgi:hypothetical protein